MPSSTQARRGLPDASPVPVLRGAAMETLRRALRTVPEKTGATDRRWQMTAKPTPKVRPPDAESSERALIGAVLSDPERVMPIVAKRNLSVDAFSDAEARRAWGAIIRLSEAGRPIDPVTVASESGLPALTLQAMIDAGIPAHCEYHADVIQGAAIKRNALRAIRLADGATAIRMACDAITAGLPSDAGGGFTVRSWGEVLDTELPPKRYFMGELFACGQVQAVFGQGGLGKSRVGTNIARNQVLGLPFLGMTTGCEPLRHLFVGSENDFHRWQVDARCMTRGLTASERQKLVNHIRMTTLEHADDCFISLADERNVMKWRDTLKSWPPDVLWVDPWGDVLEGEGFDRDVRSTISTLRKLAGAVNPDCGIVILAHSRTGAANIAQATGFDAANFGKDSKALFSSCRAVVNIAPFDQTDTPDLVWAPAKNNNARLPEKLRIRLNPDTMTYDAVEPLDVEAWQAEVRAAARMTGKKSGAKFDDDAVLGLVDTTPLTKSELHAAIRAWNTTERDTRAGMARLLRTGKLVERKAGDRNTKLVGTPQSFQT